jgi:hypothetical protein
MDNQKDQLETLSEIRSLMERSSRFISLSGLSGVFIGVFALIGTVAAYIFLSLSICSGEYYKLAFTDQGEINYSFFTFFIVDAIFILTGSFILVTVFSIRKAKENGQTIWDATAKRLVINLFIPLVAGGLFCLVLLYHGLIGLIAPATLLFYGLALINASKYTLNDIRYLGLMEIALGLIASVYIGYGLLFWAFGFGILHIVYGIVMYNKYEK